MLKLYQNRYRKIKIAIKNGGNPYYITSDEKIIFAIKKNTAIADTYVLSKVLTTIDRQDDYYILTLTSAETNINTGYYKFDIALRRTTGELETLVASDDCVIIESVTRSGTWT